MMSVGRRGRSAGRGRPAEGGEGAGDGASEACAAAPRRSNKMECGTSSTPVKQGRHNKRSLVAKRAGKKVLSGSKNASSVPPEKEPHRSVSIGMTEIAHMCTDNLLDEEVDSSHGLVTVEGYRVKPEVAPLLGNIFTKYGDIAKNSSLQSPSSRSLFLEMVCSIIQKLQGSTFRDLTSHELAAMLRDAQDLEEVRFNVGWLRNKLEEIEEMKNLVGYYPALKEQKAIIEQKKKELQEYECELEAVQMKVTFSKQDLKEVTDGYEEGCEKFVKMQHRIKDAYEKDLVDGLL